MAYGPVHKFLLRSIASRGVMSLGETDQVLNSFANERESSIQDLVKEINDVIRPFQQSIKLTNDEYTNEEVLIFLSLGYDEATKSQNIFSATELEYFRVLIEQIMTTEARQVSGIHAINLVSQMKSSFTKTDAQKLLNTWCRMRYLDKDDTNYALGVRAIHEFEGYFRQNMPDTIEDCCLCKQIVFRGYNCPGCALAVHTRCLNRYLEKVEKWPCCKIDFNPEQLERLQNADHSRLTQLQRKNVTQPSLEDTTLEQSQDTVLLQETQNTNEDVDVSHQSQDIIPEISQRITRKRARE